MLTKLRTENDVSREGRCDMSAEPKQNPAVPRREMVRIRLSRATSRQARNWRATAGPSRSKAT